MACNHRFIDKQVSKTKDLKFLFIGTFNPGWNSENGNDAEFYYGRETNLFWCIMPHAFESDCLINKGVDDWKAFCENDK